MTEEAQPQSGQSSFDDPLRFLAGQFEAGVLDDIRVLDLATFIAAPFCGTILGDFGAEVIKIEHPEGGDSLRRFGTDSGCGDTLVWLSESRNKKSMTLDSNTPRAPRSFASSSASPTSCSKTFVPAPWRNGASASRICGGSTRSS